MQLDDLLSLLGKGGVVAVLLGILYRVLFRIGDRMIAAIDRIAAKVEDNTAAVNRLDERFTTIIDMQDRTPVEPIRRVRSEPHLMRIPRKNEE